MSASNACRERKAVCKTMKEAGRRDAGSEAGHCSFRSLDEVFTKLAMTCPWSESSGDSVRGALPQLGPIL